MIMIVIMMNFLKLETKLLYNNNINNDNIVIAHPKKRKTNIFINKKKIKKIKRTKRIKKTIKIRNKKATKTKKTSRSTFTYHSQIAKPQSFKKK